MGVRLRNWINRKKLKMRTRKKVYADKVKTPPSKAREVSTAADDGGDGLKKNAMVEEIAAEKTVAAPNEVDTVVEGDSDDDEAPDDVGFSEAKSLALESIAAQKKTKLEEA